MILSPLLVASLGTALANDTIKVAIIGMGTGETADEVADQLADATWVTFETTVISESSAPVVDFSVYDVVVFGKSGNPPAVDYTQPIMVALRDYRDSGGGVVGSSLFAYQNPNLEGFLPIDMQSGVLDSHTCLGPNALTVAGTHPVTSGITDFTDTSRELDATGPLRPNAVSLMEGCGRTVVSARTATGREVYLGLLYFAEASSSDNALLRSGDADLLLEQAVEWAANCVDGDGDGALCSDCDDLNGDTFPGASEICDGLDNDCDGTLPTNESDADEDGVSVCGGDCDDDDPTRSPGQPERCDGIDNDCDGEVDEDLAGITLYPDADGDGYGAPEGQRVGCDYEEGWSDNSDDCNDTDPTIHLGAAEQPDDGIDQDCDGSDITSEPPPDDSATGCATSRPMGGAWGLGGIALLLGRRRRRSV